jgi:hypothetical protein
MAIRRPAIDTSSAEAVTGLIGLAMQFVAQGATEKLRLKEKKDAQSLILLGEQYRSVSDDLEKVESAYSQSKNLYEAQLGSVSPINRTEGSDSITGDLKDYYINEIDRRRSEKSKIQNKMNTMYSEMSDITRVQAGLLKAVTPDQGEVGVYDPEDFSTERLANIFGVKKGLIEKWREKQPEQIPSAITALEKLRLEAVQKKKGTGTLETTREQKKQMTDISSRISNARMFQDMTTIAVNDDLNDDEKVKGILSLGKEEGMSLGLILDPANEPKKGDSSKVIKKKRDAQYKEVMYLLNTFSSFTKKDAAKDVIGLGNFVNRLSNISNSLSPGAQSGFKKYVNNYFNIDLDNKEHFMLPGFALEAGQAVEESFDVRDMDKMTAEDLVLSDFKISGLSKFDYMDMAETQDKIFLLYKKKHPNLSDVDILSRIREVYNLL